MALKLNLPPIWRESYFALEYGSLARDQLYRHPPAAPCSLPVLLIPGFLTGDMHMGTLSSWLERCGHRTHTSGIRMNVDCSEAAVGRLEQRLETWVDAQGEAAVVIGQSRGGLFARALAVRRPDLVRAVVTLGSPHRAPLAVHPFIWVQGAAIAGLAAAGVPGLASRHCRSGECCRRFQRELSAPMPKGVDFVSFYSERDGIVDWRACLDPEAEQIEVGSTHCGMAVNPAVYRGLHEVLHRRSAWRAAPAKRRRRRVASGASASANG